jgi:hypothetical protein
MSVDKVYVDKMNVDKMSKYNTSVEKMSLDAMTVDQKTCFHELNDFFHLYFLITFVTPSLAVRTTLFNECRRKTKLATANKNKKVLPKINWIVKSENIGYF